MLELGRNLRRAREERGLTVEKVAASTRLTSHYVRAIEAGRMAELPPEPYRRGFVMAVARTVGVDVAEARSAWDAAHPRDAEGAVATPVEHAPAAQRLSPIAVALFVLLVVVAVAALVGARLSDEPIQESEHALASLDGGTHV